MTPNRPGPGARHLFTGILALGLAVVACSLAPSAATPSLPPNTSGAGSSLAAATDTPLPATPSALPSDTPGVPAASVANFPDPQQYQWTQVVGGLAAPTGIYNAGDGSGRLFIVEQPGRVRILQGGSLLPTPYLDITDRVGADSSERGLLGLAFDPQYKQNGFFYVNYTDLNGNTVIARFKVTADPNLADPASEKKLLGVQQPFANHNGGSVVFGPDGFLYLGLGDGGSAGDPYGNGQSTNTLLGKILRIDVEHGDPYAIPPGNPFANGGGKPEIWAYGLRNPWRFSFDPATGDMYIGDVGQDTWEEIDYLPAGSPGGTNFGWNQMEGLHPYKGSNSAAFTAPVINYSHAEGGCSVTGGYVYRGKALPAWDGVYFYGDYCSGKIWGLLKSGSGWQSQHLFDTGLSISTFGVDESGELYLAWYGGGIYKLVKQ